MADLIKKTTGQKWVVFAFDRTDNVPKAGDAANITANLRIDGAAANAVDDTNPTELEDGYYYFDLTAAETDGNMITICPASSTGDIQVLGVPGTVFTRRGESSHVHHVAKTGNDSNGGHSFESAVLTIGQAVTNASAGDTIIIYPGTYAETVSPAVAVTIQGTDRGGVIIQSAAGNAINPCDGCTIRNLTADGSGFGHGISYLGHSNVVVEDCIVLGVADGMYPRGSRDCRISRCTITHEFDGINASGAQNIIIEDCAIYMDSPSAVGNECRGIIVGSDGYGIIRNCTIYNYRNDVSSEDMVGLMIGDALGAANFVVENVQVFCSGTSNHTGNAICVQLNDADTKAALINCTLHSNSVGGGETDIDVNDSATLYVMNCNYSSSSGTLNSTPQDVMVSNNLDHLMKTAVADGDDMTVEVVDGSVLSNLMTAGGDTSDFVRITDTLEALGQPVAGAYQCTLTIQTTGGVAIEGARCWLSLSSSGSPAYAGFLTTDNLGQVVGQR